MAAASGAAGAPLVEVSHLTKRYGDFAAVDDLSFSVHAGEVFGLLGPNGAGKTTTILTLLGLTDPSGGTVRVLGRDPARDALAVKRQVGYLPDAVGFYARLTARENLRYTARLNGIDPDAANGRIDDLLDRVGLTAARDQRTGTFSRGMLQRLGIADALLKEPRVLILDEPTASIDPAGVAEMLGLITGLVRERGLAALLSSHLLGQVEDVCDRMAIFQRGRLIASGSLEELRAQAAAPGASLEAIYLRLVEAAEAERKEAERVSA
jgi:ABC-2 type transport system ATP-binding protein